MLLVTFMENEQVVYALMIDKQLGMKMTSPCPFYTGISCVTFLSTVACFNI